MPSAKNAGVGARCATSSGAGASGSSETASQPSHNRVVERWPTRPAAIARSVPSASRIAMAGMHPIAKRIRGRIRAAAVSRTRPMAA